MTEDQAPNVDLSTLLTLMGEIVAAYAGNTELTPAELTETIGAVARTLAAIGASSGKPKDQAPIPAMPIKKSVTPDFIICLEDGEKFQMLKRHLKTTYGLTPAQYREKWGLPSNYPMVAPNYAAARAALAKRIGLGTKTKPAQATAEATPIPSRGRRAKTAS